MPAVKHLTVFVEVVSLAVDLLVVVNNFLTLAVEVVPVISILVRIRDILVSCCLNPLIL